MKKTSKARRVGSAFLAAAIVFTSFGASLTAFAADSWPNDKASAEPSFAGYRVKDIENWDPETDPYAEFLRAEVPLQTRNEPFKETQAKTYLNSDAQVMLMQGDYGNSFFNSTMYTDKFGEHVLNFWQYADYFSPWHGAATAYTPESLYDPVTSDWRARGFEFGIVNIPNPAYTNAAHKNGVMSIACIYFDPAFRPGQTCADLIERDEDGNFSIAEKLIQMAEYYGFDGYFLNQEEGYYEDFKPFMAELTEAGLYTQWYDTNSYFNSSKAQWLEDDTNGRINDSVFVNYGWTGGVDSSISYAESIGVDPFERLFFGLECNQNKFSGSHSSAREIANLYDETGNPRASVALFTPSDWYQRGVDEIPAYDPNDTPVMQQDEYQWMVAERERMFFSGVMEDPTDTGLKSGYSRTDVGVSNASGWVGVADFIAERSVIDGTKFNTNFNTGHGMQYFVDGEVSADKAWTNINIQDILPSWQWWVDSTDDNKLEVDFDYGAALTNNDVNGNPMTMPYTQVGAYEGGSSLVVYGDITDSNSLHLYKTDLDVNENSKAYVTFKKTSADSVPMQLGLIFKDNANQTVKLPIAGSETAGNWTTAEIDLSSYAGKQIAAITLEFEGQAEGYQMNVGGLKVSDGADKPAAPTGFKVDYAYDSGEMILSWNMADYDEVKQYNVYGTLSNGQRVYLGGVYDSILYVKSVFDESESIDLELRAVGADGTESDPATLTYTYNDKVSNVAVEEAETSTGLLVRAATPGQLDVSFDTPAAGAPDSYEFEVTLRNIKSDDPDNQVYTGSAEGTATSATINLPVDEGREYDLKIYAVYDGERGEPICYRGWSNDNYSEPIAKEDIRLSGNSVRLVDPDSVDWYKMTATFNGEQVGSFTRGASSGNSMRFSLSGDGTLSVVTQDFAGNTSIPTVVQIADGQIVDPTDLIGSEQFPDEALLAAVQKQVGVTLASLEEFTGTLNLANSEVADLTGLDLIPGLTGLNLSNCTALTDLSGLDANTALTEINISGCTALETVDLASLGLEKLDASGEYANLVSVDISDNKLDLSEGTPERAFVDAALAATSDVAETQAADGENLVTGATLIGSNNVTDASKFVDGSTTTDTAATDRNKPASVTLDLGSEKEISAWSIWIKTNTDASFRPFGVKNAELAVADTADGEYTTISTLETVPADTADTLSETVAELETPVTARYVKITVTEWQPHPNGGVDWPAMVEAMIYGGEGAPAQAVKFDNQRPVVYSGVEFLPDEPVRMEISDETVDLMSYVDTAYTVRGNVYADMADQLINGETFLADDVDVNAKPSETFTVSVVDQNNGAVEGPVVSLTEDITYIATYKNADGEIAGTLTIIVGDGGEVTTPTVITENPTILYATEQSDHNSKEDPEMAFDKDETTKWCPGGNAVQAQMVIDVGAYYTLTEWNMSHAGVSTSDGVGRNTRDFALQILNVENPTAEQLADESFLTNDANWTTVAFYENNQETRTHYEFTETVTARYFRLNVTKGDTSIMWPSTRIYEWSMLGVPYYGGGEEEVDKTELAALVEQAAQYVQADYTAESWAVFAQAYADAQEVLANDEATAADVAGAVEALNSAIAQLEIDKSALAAALEDAAQYEEANYTDETWTVFAQAYENAQAVMEDDTATAADVADAVEALNNAIAQLENYVAPDKSLLQYAYDYALTQNTEGVVDSAAKFFEEAVAQAKAVLDDAKATEEEVNAAFDKLLEGIWGLGLVQGDKTNLNLLIARAEDMVLNADKYVADNWQQLLDALEAAQAVAADGDAMKGDVETAANDLLSAILAQRYKADKSILEELINQASGLDLSQYTAASVQAFSAALRSANLVLEDATLSVDDQATVDEAVATLRSAMDELEPLSSNTGDDNANTGDNADDNKDNSDKDTASDPNKGPMDNNGNKTPATGDNTPVLWIVLGTVAAAAILVILVIVLRRRANRA